MFIRCCSFAVLLIACSAEQEDAAGHPSSSSLPDASHYAVDSTDDAQNGQSCRVDGCLRSRSFVGRFSAAELVPLFEAGVAIDNGYEIHTIRYWSQGGEVGATLAVPAGIGAPVGGWHVVVNNHGTTGIADACAITGTTWGSGLAGELGARGLIGIAPDYPGLGAPGVHPYLVSESEGRSALDALRAAARFAAAVNLNISGRYGVVGLSQGGHAALAAAAQHRAYAPELDVRAFAAAGPATVREELWRTALSFSGEHVAYHALVAYAWAARYEFFGPSPFAPLVAASIDQWMDDACMFTPMAEVPLLKDLLPHDPTALFSPAFLHGYTTGEWGEFSAFHDYFTANRIGPYDQTAPLRIYQGDDDAIVPEAHTAALVEELRGAGLSVDYVRVAGGGHTNVAFSFVAQKQERSAEAVAWLKAQLDR